MAYNIQLVPVVEGHLRALSAAHRVAVVDAMQKHLSDQPTAITRNRKPMRPNPYGAWELRVGDLRVYYRVLEEEKVVQIGAVAVKVHERILIGGEEVKL